MTGSWCLCRRSQAKRPVLILGRHLGDPLDTEAPARGRRFLFGSPCSPGLVRIRKAVGDGGKSQ